MHPTVRGNIIIWILLGLVLISAGFYYFWYQPYVLNQSERDYKVCTQEAKLCPDGKTSVSRTGPNCEFAACPGENAHSSVQDFEKNTEQTAIDTSNWKTYRNEKYGFEVRYPKEWTTATREAGDATFFTTTKSNFYIAEISVSENEFGGEKTGTVAVGGVQIDVKRFYYNPCGGFAANIPYRKKFLIFTVNDCAVYCNPEDHNNNSSRCETITANMLLSEILSTFKFTK